MEKKFIILCIAGIIVIATIIASLVFVNNEPGECDYRSLNIKYYGKSVAECSNVDYSCASGFRSFYNQCGCGCRAEEGYQANMTYCQDVERNRICLQVYQPVCGWFSPAEVQCLRYPCAKSYSNSCFACTDEKVEYWSEGECPI